MDFEFLEFFWDNDHEGVPLPAGNEIAWVQGRRRLYPREGVADDTGASIECEGSEPSPNDDEQNLPSEEFKGLCVEGWIGLWKQLAKSAIDVPDQEIDRLWDWSPRSLKDLVAHAAYWSLSDRDLAKQVGAKPKQLRHIRRELGQQIPHASRIDWDRTGAQTA